MKIGLNHSSLVRVVKVGMSLPAVHLIKSSHSFKWDGKEVRMTQEFGEMRWVIPNLVFLIRHKVVFNMYNVDVNL